MSYQFFKGLSSFGSKAASSDARNDFAAESLLAVQSEQTDRKDLNRGLEDRVNQRLEQERADRQALMQQRLNDARTNAPFLGRPPGWV